MNTDAAPTITPPRSPAGTPDPAVARAMSPDEREPEGVEHELGDFTVGVGVLRMVALAAVVGVLSAVVALVLLQLIALATNLAYFQDWSTELRTPAGNGLGLLAALIPGWVAWWWG